MCLFPRAAVQITTALVTQTIKNAQRSDSLLYSLCMQLSDLVLHICGSALGNIILCLRGSMCFLSPSLTTHLLPEESQSPSNHHSVLAWFSTYGSSVCNVAIPHNLVWHLYS